MLVFVIPLKSSQVSASWERVSRLFERCLQSVCNQTSPDFRVVVVCHEKPEVEFSHPKVTYLSLRFPLESAGVDSTTLLNNKRTDKGRKILAGLVYTQRFKPTHTMVVDADDCVSKHLARFVNQHPEHNGWFINKGYRYEEGSEAIYFKRKDFYRMCGTCNLVRYDLNNLPEPPEFNRGYGYYKYYIDHAKVRGMLAEKGTPLDPLPFPGAVYMTETGEHLYYSKNHLYQGIFRRFNYRPLSQSICDEFSLYPLSSASRLVKAVR